MNIAIATQVYLPYTQAWIYRQMKGMRGNVTTVICNQKENLDIFPFNFIEVIPERSLFLRKVAYKLHAIVKFIPFKVSKRKRRGYCQVLKNNNINLLHAHFGVMAIEFMDICRELEIPLVVTFHGFDITAAIKRDPSYHQALKQLFKSMTLGIAISHEMKKRLIELGCPPEKIQVSYLGIPLDEFEFVDRSSHKSTVKFLHAGRFSDTKGVPDLVRAFSLAFEKEDDVQLMIAGDGENKSMVMETIQKSPVKDKIRYLGKLTNEELARYRNECDVFVLNCRTPSSGDKEGLPIALLEASGTGLPVISTWHAGIAEGILHEQTGLLVNEYSNHELSIAMRRLMDSSLRLQLGKQGRKWMEQQFDLKKCNEVLWQLYEQAIQKK